MAEATPGDLTPAQRERVDRLLQAALREPPEARASYVEDLCTDDPPVRDEVLSLLSELDVGLDSPILPTSPDPLLADASTALFATPASVPRKIGRYTIRRVIASGGMATVYEAMQAQPRRRVAVKVMKHGITSRSAMRRLEFESQILARLHHPNIAQVFEAGMHDDGVGAVPHFAMEYIPNAKPITEYARAKEPSTRECLALFAKVCDAVHHGHQKGIIHRDLKPSNILVDSNGEPKIIDFGVARATDSDLAVTTLQTDVGQLIGTVQYMSPEQCDADPTDLDTRSDVYALGLVLYELLCAQLPYDVRQVPIHEAARVIREEAPARPSTINRTLRGDVETITLRALEKDRQRRYQSAADLAQDIQRYLADEPIEARPPSVVYQIHKFARRNRGAFAALVFVGFVLVAATAVSSFFAWGAAVERREAAVEREKADLQRYVASIAGASESTRRRDFKTARWLLEAAPESHRGWEWRFLQASLDESILHIDAGVGRVALVPNGRSFVAEDTQSGLLRVRDLRTAADRRTIDLGGRTCRALAVSPDGQRVAVSLDDGTVAAHELGSGELVRSFDADSCDWLGFTSEETLAFRDDARIRVADLTTGRSIGTLPVAISRKWTPPIDLSLDGRTLAAQTDAVRVFDLTDGSVLRTFDSETFRGVAISDDGERVLCWDTDTVSVREVDTGEEVIHLTSPFSPRANRYTCAFVASGREIAVMSRDSVDIHDLESGRRIRTLAFPDSRYAVRLLPCDEEDLLVITTDPATSDGGMCVFELHPGHSGLVAPPNSPVRELALAPSSSMLCVATADGRIGLWDIDAKLHVADLGTLSQVTDLAFSPDERLIAAASEDGDIHVWSTTSAAWIELTHLVAALPWPPSVSWRVEFDAGSRFLLNQPNLIGPGFRLWDVERQTELELTTKGIARYGTAAFTTDGRLLARPPGRPVPVAITRVEGSHLAWALPELRPAATAEGDLGAFYGRWMLPDGFERDKLVLRIRSGNENIPLLRLGEDLTTLVFDDTHDRFITGSHTGEILIWETVPYRVRLQRQREARARYEIVRPIVDRLFDELGSAEQVATRLDGDATLSTEQRRTAHNLVVRRALAHDSPAAERDAESVRSDP